MPTPIQISCPYKITTKIICGTTHIEDAYGETMQSRAAKMIVEHAHYNEIFEVQAVKKTAKTGDFVSTGNFERARAEATRFTTALRAAMKDKPELNLMILGDNPEQWEAHKAQNVKIQKEILKKAKMVADKMVAYPKTIANNDLQNAANAASDAELLKAKILVETMVESTEISTQRKELEADFTPLLIVSFMGSAIALIFILASTIALAWIALPISLMLVVVIASAMAQMQIEQTKSQLNSEIEKFYLQIGRNQILPELAKISPEFLKELEAPAISKVSLHSAIPTKDPVAPSLTPNKSHSAPSSPRKK